MVTNSTPTFSQRLFPEFAMRKEKGAVKSQGDNAISPTQKSVNDPLASILQGLRAAGKTDETHAYVDPAAHVLLEAPAPETTQIAFAQLLQRKATYGCRYTLEGYSYEYVLKKSCQTLLEWVNGFAKLHSIKISTFLRGSECTRELGSTWFKGELAKDVEGNLDALPTSELDEHVVDVDIHFECLNQKKGELLWRGFQLNWIYEHFRSPIFHIFLLEGNVQCVGLETVVDYLLKLTDLNPLVSIHISDETIPWLSKRDIIGPKLSELLAAIKELECNWSHLKKFSPQAARDETLFPLACRFLFHCTPAEFEKKITDIAVLPSKPHSVFKLDRKGEILKDYNRFTCLDENGDELDFIFFNPRGNQTPKDRLVSQAVYLQIPSSPSQISELKVTWSRQAILDRVCKIGRWRNTIDTDARDWVYLMFLRSKGYFFVQPHLAQILQDNFLQTTTHLDTLIGDLQSIIDKIKKKKTPDQASHICIFLLNASLDLPVSKLPEALFQGIWNTLFFSFAELQPFLQILLPHRQPIHRSTLYVFLQWLGHRHLMAPEIKSPHAPFQAHLVTLGTEVILQMRFKGGSIHLPYLPDQASLALKNQVEELERNEVEPSLHWLQNALKQSGVSETFERRQNELLIPPTLLTNLQNLANQCFFTCSLFNIRMGLGFLIDCFQTKKDLTTALPLIYHFSILLYHEQEEAQRKLISKLVEEALELFELNGKAKKNLGKVCVELIAEPVLSAKGMVSWVQNLGQAGGREGQLCEAAVAIWSSYSFSLTREEQINFTFTLAAYFAKKNSSLALKFLTLLQMRKLGTVEEWKKALQMLFEVSLDPPQIYRLCDFLRDIQERYPDQVQDCTAIIVTKIDELLCGIHFVEAFLLISIASQRLLGMPTGYLRLATVLSESCLNPSYARPQMLTELRYRGSSENKIGMEIFYGLLSHWANPFPFLKDEFKQILKEVSCAFINDSHAITFLQKSIQQELLTPLEASSIWLQRLSSLNPITHLHTLIALWEMGATAGLLDLLDYELHYSFLVRFLKALFISDSHSAFARTLCDRIKAESGKQLDDSISFLLKKKTQIEVFKELLTNYTLRKSKNFLPKLLQTVDIDDGEQVQSLADLLSSSLPELCTPSGNKWGGIALIQEVLTHPNIQKILGENYHSLCVHLLTIFETAASTSSPMELHSLVEIILRTTQAPVVMQATGQVLVTYSIGKGLGSLNAVLEQHCVELCNNSEGTILLHLFIPMHKRIPVRAELLTTRLLEALNTHIISKSHAPSLKDCISAFLANLTSYTDIQIELCKEIYLALLKQHHYQLAEMLASKVLRPLLIKIQALTQVELDYWLQVSRLLISAPKLLAYCTLVPLLYTRCKTVPNAVQIQVNEIPEKVLADHPIECATLLKNCGWSPQERKMDAKIRRYVKFVGVEKPSDLKFRHALHLLDLLDYPSYPLWTELFHQIQAYCLGLGKEGFAVSRSLLNEAHRIALKRGVNLELLGKDAHLFHEWTLFDAASDVLLFTHYALQMDRKAKDPELEIILKRLETLEDVNDPPNRLYPHKPVRFSRLTRALENLCTISRTHFVGVPVAAFVTCIYTLRQSLSDHLTSTKVRAKLDTVVACILVISEIEREFLTGFELFIDALSVTQPEDISDQVLLTLINYFQGAEEKKLEEDLCIPLIAKATVYYQKHLLHRIDPLYWVSVLSAFPTEDFLSQASDLAMHRLTISPEKKFSADLLYPFKETNNVYFNLLYALVEEHTPHSLSQVYTLFNNPRVKQLFTAEQCAVLVSCINNDIVNLLSEGSVLENWGLKLWSLLLKMETSYFTSYTLTTLDASCSQVTTNWVKHYKQKISYNGSVGLRILQVVCLNYLNYICATKFYSGKAPISSLSALLDEFFTQARLALVESKDTCDPFSLYTSFMATASLVRDLESLTPPSSALGWLYLNFVTSLLNMMRNNNSEYALEILNALNRFAFHPSAQLSKYNIAHTTCLELLVGPMEFDDLFKIPPEGYKLFYQVRLYGLNKRPVMEFFALTEEEEVAVIRETIVRLQTLKHPLAIQRAGQLFINTQSFLKSTQQEKLERMLELCSHLTIQPDETGPAEAAVILLLNETQTLLHQIPLNDPLRPLAVKLFEKAIDTGFRLFKEGGIRFENENQRKILSQVIELCHSPTAEIEIAAHPLYLEELVDKYLPLLRAWSNALFKTLPEEAQLSFQQMNVFKNILKEVSFLFARMKKFPSNSMREEALRIWLRLHDKMLAISPAELLVNQWLGYGAQIGCFNGENLYETFIQQLEKGIEYTFKKMPPGLQRASEITLLAFMLFPQTHGLLPPTAKHAFARLNLIEIYLNLLTEADLPNVLGIITNPNLSESTQQTVVSSLAKFSPLPVFSPAEHIIHTYQPH